jgi:hypothetical protein
VPDFVSQHPGAYLDESQGATGCAHACCHELWYEISIYTACHEHTCTHVYSSMLLLLAWGWNAAALVEVVSLSYGGPHGVSYMWARSPQQEWHYPAPGFFWILLFTTLRSGTPRLRPCKCDRQDRQAGRQAGRQATHAAAGPHGRNVVTMLGKRCTS